MIAQGFSFVLSIHLFKIYYKMTILYDVFKLEIKINVDFF